MMEKFKDINFSENRLIDDLKKNYPYNLDEFNKLATYINPYSMTKEEAASFLEWALERVRDLLKEDASLSLKNEISKVLKEHG